MQGGFPGRFASLALITILAVKCFLTTKNFCKFLDIFILSLIGIHTNCLNPQPNYLNAFFYLYRISSLFRPTSSYWILTFVNSFESFRKESRLHNFCKKICTDFKQTLLDIFSFHLMHIYVLKMLQIFLHIFLEHKGFPEMCKILKTCFTT